MSNIQEGDRVRMSETLKARMRGSCLPGKHVDPFVEDMPDDGCLHCSTSHVEEFGECVGIVIGSMWPNGEGPEVDVRWQPSNLRYGYNPVDLEKVAS